MLTFDLFTAKVKFASPFVWAIYIYIESIEVTCRSAVVKIVLIGNLRWPSSGLYLLYFPATVLFTCIKSWFFRNHLANFHQISHFIEPSGEMWLIVHSNDHAPLTVRPVYSSSKLRTSQMMIFSLVVMIGLEKCCITSACLQWLCHSGEWTVARGPLVSTLTSIGRTLKIFLSEEGLWCLVCSFILLISTKIIQTIALKSKMTLLHWSLGFYRLIRNFLETTGLNKIKFHMEP